MSPKNKKSNKNNKKNGSNSSLKKNIVSPTQSDENIAPAPGPMPAQSNSVESMHNLEKDLKDILGDINLETTNTSTNEVDKTPASYDITTTYKTEIIECTVDPDSGDIVEVVTEVYVTDEISLNKETSKEDQLKKPVVMEPVEEFDLDDILKQLNMGTEICKELLLPVP